MPQPGSAPLALATRKPPSGLSGQSAALSPVVQPSKQSGGGLNPSSNAPAPSSVSTSGVPSSSSSVYSPVSSSSVSLPGTTSSAASASGAAELDEVLSAARVALTTVSPSLTATQVDEQLRAMAHALRDLQSRQKGFCRMFAEQVRAAGPPTLAASAPVVSPSHGDFAQPNERVKDPRVSAPAIVATVAAPSSASPTQVRTQFSQYLLKRWRGRVADGAATANPSAS